LMVVLSTADGFRASVRTLRSLGGKEGVSFHTFTLPEDRCVRLLGKNLDRGRPESVVREKLESLDIQPRSCDPGVAIRNPPMSALPPLISSVRGARAGGVKRTSTHRNLQLASVSGIVRGSKRPVAMQALPAFRPQATKLRIRTPVLRV
jgi:hypothetical protein